jgi:phosphatidate cytidylyltransferase
VKARILSALVLAPIMIALVILGGWWFLAGIGVACAIGAWEAYGLLASILKAPTDGEWRYLAGVAAAVLLIGVQLGFDRTFATQVVWAAVLIGSLLALLAGGKPSNRFLLWAAAMAAVLYVVGLGSHFLLLRETKQGLGWTVLACAVTWSTDIGAFFVGRAWGKTHFFALISPKKTLEGAAGGLFAGTVTGLFVIFAADLHVPGFAAPLVGLSLSAVAQAGDLVESMLKREAGVKDSGTIIPGHGGVLDRIDSLLFVVALAFYWRLLFS